MMESHFRPIFTSLIALMALATGLASPGASATERGPVVRASAPQDDPSGARVIVKFKALGTFMHALRAAPSAAAGPQMAVALGQRHALSLRNGAIIEGRSQVVRGSAGTSSAALAAVLSADPEVEYAVPDERRHLLAVPNDPLYAGGSTVSPAVGQWYLQPPTSSVPAAINALGAWAITTGGASLVVADVDTGVRFEHPDLTNKLLPGRNFVSTNGVSGAGWSADATDPGDFTTTTNQCGDGAAPQNSSWHGTQTAGIIGAQTNNGIGMASVGHDVKVLPVRVLGACGGRDSDIIAGMLWAGGVSSNPVANPTPAKVINLSLGASGSCSAAYLDAVQQLNAAGVVVVAAAGNDEGLAVASPANCSGVIAVAGLRQAGTKVGYSDIGPQVAISAPAGNCVNTTGACLYPILTTTNAGATTATTSTYTDATHPSLGTSFAAPQVTGTVALMMYANPSLTAAQVLSTLRGSANAFPTHSPDAGVTACQAPNGSTQDECLCTTSTCGAGMLNAAAALAAATGTSGPSAAVLPATSTVTAGQDVTFASTGSAVPSGRTIASYDWSIAAGSGSASFTTGTNGASVTLHATGAGNVIVQLIVTDSSGATATAQSTLVVNAAAAPTAAIVSSANAVGGGTAVTLDGSESAAASGLSIVSYQWTLTSGSAFASFSSSTNASTATLQTAAAGGGTVTVMLTVTDSQGLQGSTTTTVTVSSTVPTASIGTSATTLVAGSSLTLDGSASVAPAGRTITAYQWSIGSGASIATFTGSTTSPTALVTANAAGSFTVMLTVTDSAGAQGTQTQAFAATAATSSAAPGGGGGGGGGALDWMSLFGLALAVAGVSGVTRLGRRRT